MPTRMLYRLSGIALLLGTLLTVLFSSIEFILFGGNQLSYLFAANGLNMLSHRLFETVTEPLWLPVNLMILVGLMLIVAGLPGMYTYLAKRAGWLGLIGFVLTMVAILLEGIINQALLTFVLPLIAPHIPHMLQTGRTSLNLGAFYPVSSLFFSLGSFLLGFSIFRTVALPDQTKVTGIALIVAAVCNTLHFIPLPGGIESLITIGNIAGALSFLIGLAVFSYFLVSQSGAETVQSPSDLRRRGYKYVTRNAVSLKRASLTRGKCARFSV